MQDLTSVFDVFKLSTAITNIPIRPTKITDLKLFSEKMHKTSYVRLEEMNETIRVLPALPHDAPPEYIRHGKRKVRLFEIPRLSAMDVILPDDIQDVRAFGTSDVLQTISSVIADRLNEIKNNIFLPTLEWMMMGAIKGIITDGTGATLLNLFTEFGITQKSVDFDLDTDTTDVLTKCLAAKRLSEQALGGEVIRGFHAFCSPEFFDALVSHDSVKDAFRGYQAAMSMLSEDRRSGFTFGGITFEEYYATLTIGGTQTPMIEPRTAYMFPIGTSIFEINYAPARTSATVNTIAIPYYAMLEKRKFDRGYDLLVESNPLPICTKPGALVKLYF
ncbi:MAG: major capsid protein [Nitrososphaerota archaeon]